MRLLGSFLALRPKGLLMVRLRGSVDRSRLLALVVVGMLASVTAACTSPEDRSEPPATRPVSAPFTVSYEGAASRLAGLPAEDVADQVRDWARIGLATRLGLTSRQIRDASYDTLPVRDAGFADLSRQVNGPGRALYDGKGTLHLLVPEGDPHASRTIGLLLDQYRTDTGADAPSVQLERYRIQDPSHAVLVTPGPVTPVAQARTANGYVTMRITGAADLRSFLARSTSLSRLDVHDSGVWASGWAWSVPAGARMAAADVSVLQRGYAGASGPTPGFSLDPPESLTGSRVSVEDLLAIAPQLSRDVAQAVANDAWPSGGFASKEDFSRAVEDQLFGGGQERGGRVRGLPTDRTQLWAISAALRGRPLYSQARYDGGLAGTEVGMTLFYTDYVAKNWSAGVGRGVPAAAVAGFVPDPGAVTPWSECAAAGTDTFESGRLWFGQNDAAFGPGPSAVNLGAAPTRLFARSDAAGGTEVETSFAFGRGLRWWDQHVQAVADYEPQYERLNQIMRWSGALDWLTSSTTARLPQLDTADVATGLTFRDWYTRHTELRERAPVQFVTPPSATQEAVAALPSRTFTGCGGLWISGGVSLGNRAERLARQGHSQEPHLPSQVSRAGVHDSGSTVDEATGSGRIIDLAVDDSGAVSDRLERVLGAGPEGHQTVKVAGQGRRVSPLGALKIWRSGTAGRTLALDVDAGAGRVVERVSLQGHDLGRLTALSSPGAVIVHWTPGAIDRARTILESLQAKLTAHPGEALPDATDGVLYAYRDLRGQTLYRVDDGSQWLEVSGDVPPAGDAFALRLGAPGARDGDNPRFFVGTLPTDPPPGLAGGAGGAGAGGPGGGGAGGPGGGGADGGGGGDERWLAVAPPGPGRPAIISFISQPGKAARAVRVSTPEGATATLSIGADGHPVVLAGDPLLGVAGPAVAAALERDFPAVSRAMGDAVGEPVGTYRVVALGSEGQALVRADGILLVESGHPWSGAARRTLEGAVPGQPPRVRIIDGHLFTIGSGPLTVPGPARTVRLEDVVPAPGADVYLNERFRSTLTFHDGQLIASALPPDTLVVVREAHDAPASRPDVQEYRQADWYQVKRFTGVRANAPSSPSATATTASGSTEASGAPGAVLLVCPSDATAPGCSS
jgi:hypothetical protein